MVLRWWRALAAGSLFVPVLALVFFTPSGLARILFQRNFLEVVPGIFRSAQPTHADWEAWRDEPGFRSVLSLRHPKPGETWYEDEIAFVRAHALQYHAVPLSGEHLPPPAKLKDILHFLEEAPRPLLLHCSAGVERSGLGAALAVLLENGDPVRARQEFGRNRGFIEWLGISDLPQFVDLYAAWLEDEGLEPHPDRFRHWANTVYTPYFYRADLELVRRVENRFSILVTNRSGKTIPLRERAPGVRLGAHWHPDSGDALELRGDPKDHDLAPGASVEIELNVPEGLREGLVRIDLVDEGRKWFADMGSPVLSIPLALDSP